MACRLGYVLSLLSSVFISLAHFLVSLKHNEMSPVENATLTGILGSVILIPVAMIMKSSFRVPVNERCYVFWHSIFIGTSIFTTFSSLRFIAPFDASVLIDTFPIIATVLSYLWLKEKLIFSDIIAVLLTLTGIVLISKPSFLFNSTAIRGSPFDKTIGYALAIVSGFIIAVGFTINRKIQETSAIVVELYVMPVAIVLGTIFTLSTSGFNIPSTVLNAVIPISASILYILCHIILVRAFQLEDVSPVSVINGLDSVFMLLWQIIFLHNFPNVYGLIGASLCAISLLLILCRDRILLMVSNSSSNHSWSSITNNRNYENIH